MNQMNGTTNDRIKINLDHLYCHPIENTNNYITQQVTNSNLSNNTSNASNGNNNGNHNTDLYKVFNENKQLKSMLLLHLDLIQEQSDQLINKEKNIAVLKHENELLKTKIERMSQKIRQQKHLSLNQQNQTPILQPQQAQATQITQQQQNLVIKKEKTDEIEKSENNYAITTQSALLNNISDIKPNSGHLIKVSTDPNSSVIGENNGQFINKIVLQRKILKHISSTQQSQNISVPVSLVEIQKIKPETHQTASIKITDDKNECTIITSIEQTNKRNVPTALEDDDNSLISTIVIENNDIKIEEDSKSPCDINTIIEIDDNDESLDEHEIIEVKKRKRMLSEPTSTTSSTSQSQYYYRGISMITDKDYITRDWQTDEIENELKQINENLLLEVPSWTVKECAGCYSIEGTEDLSEETFLKRHLKYEIDERRRKKWDVQRIREQRTIERLKRRHYKRELMEENEENKKKENSFTSFYPPIDNIKYIEVTQELPVQAFGENIPKIPIQTEFSLPWISYLSTNTSHNSKSSNSSNNHTNIKLADNSGMELIKSRTNNSIINPLVNKRKALSFNSFQKGG